MKGKFIGRPPEAVAAGTAEKDRLSHSSINRYNTTKLAYEGAEAAAIPITGVFRAGSARSFAAAVAAAYNLEIKESGDRLVLAGTPDARDSQ